MLEKELKSALKVAEECAKEAGKILEKYYSKKYKAEHKGPQDWVTEVDIISENTIKEFLMREFPANFVSEESGKEDIASELTWIVDPLDGTRNYMRKIPFFCVSIALMKMDEILLGVVYNPIRGEIYKSIKGKGAYLNGKRIFVSEVSAPYLSFLATGFPFKLHEYIDEYAESFKMVFKVVSGVRRIGSAALDLCMTASGVFDGFWEAGLNLWDVAAGSIILKEAGGKITDFWGEDNWFKTGCVVGTNGKIHDFLVSITKASFKKRDSF